MHVHIEIVVPENIHTCTPQWRELEILERWGLKTKTQKLPEGRAVDDCFSFQISFDSIWIQVLM